MISSLDSCNTNRHGLPLATWRPREQTQAQRLGSLGTVSLCRQGHVSAQFQQVTSVRRLERTHLSIPGFNALRPTFEPGTASLAIILAGSEQRLAAVRPHGGRLPGCAGKASLYRAKQRAQHRLGAVYDAKARQRSTLLPDTVGHDGSGI